MSFNWRWPEDVLSRTFQIFYSMAQAIATGNIKKASASDF